MKPSGSPDLALIVSDTPCTAAGVFTKNKLPGAPVVVAKRHLRRNGVRAIVCNSGIANDATGQEGIDNAVATTRIVARQLGCDHRSVLPSSTGVIGPQLPMDKIENGIDAIAPKLASGAKANAAAARAIMTTDLVPKSGHREVTIGRKKVHIGGIAKGSGMIAPNMATMLVFITTDAAIDTVMLKRCLKNAVNTSFNRISVDQHTSPSDMVIVLANGEAGNRTITKDGAPYRAFSEALTDLCQDLAYQIVKDGEGATKIIRVRIRGARSIRDADRVGKAIVDSPLVKTAVHGEDPNWGRIVTAAGYSGAAISPDRMSLHIGDPKKGSGDICVFRKGQPINTDTKSIRVSNRLMKQKEVVFTIDIGLGKADADWLGCDLSRQYITINADYTT